MPGRHDRDRLLALELQPGCLAGARGMIGAAGDLAATPGLAALVARERRNERSRIRRSHAA